MLTVTRYTANWCNPCKALSPVFNELERENPEVNFKTIDIDIYKPEGVTSIPYVVIEKNGHIISQTTGIKPKNFYSTLIKANL